MNLTSCLALSVTLLAIGVYGLLTRRNLIGMLLAVEVILNGANINFISFAHFRAHDPTAGALFPIFVIAVSAAEMAVALALTVALYRNRRHVDVRALRRLHG